MSYKLWWGRIDILIVTLRYISSVGNDGWIAYRLFSKITRLGVIVSNHQYEQLTNGGQCFCKVNSIFRLLHLDMWVRWVMMGKSPVEYFRNSPVQASQYQNNDASNWLMPCNVKWNRYYDCYTLICEFELIGYSVARSRLMCAFGVVDWSVAIRFVLVRIRSYVNVSLCCVE